MAKAYRSKYPEAGTKANHYRNVVTTLQTRRSSLQDDIKKARKRRPADYEDIKLEGDYYTKYLDKKDVWITQFDQITTTFDRFLQQVDKCIQNADNLEKMWNSRISIMEVYDDGT